MALIDIALDPFPHNAGTTTIEALWQGVPVVTLAGRPTVGRFGASILHAVGLDDWVTGDVDAYVARAVAAASDLRRAGAVARHAARPHGRLALAGCRRPGPAGGTGLPDDAGGGAQRAGAGTGGGLMGGSGRSAGDRTNTLAPSVGGRGMEEAVYAQLRPVAGRTFPPSHTRKRTR